ncbi:MAG TPA: GreA/GreB family elongation factor [Polyangiaceae bacterium]|nr:GreA/GreB family elongation factor [Polyangiaceae bacterium]
MTGHLGSSTASRSPAGGASPEKQSRVQVTAARGRISVLAPVGSALLGLAVGETIEWPLPAGQAKRLRVVEVVYQPEQAGDFHL